MKTNTKYLFNNSCTDNKAVHGLSPEYISKLFTFRNCDKDLQGIDILTLPRAATTSYGLHSVSYYGSKLWNSLPNNIRAIPELRKFEFVISDLIMDTDDCTFCG